MRNIKIRIPFLKFYFWYLLVLATVATWNDFSFDIEDILNTVFTYVAFIPFFGCAFRKKIFSNKLWKPFLFFFFLWESYCYIFMTVDFLDDLLVFAILIPKYWSLISYSFFFMEKNEILKGKFMALRKGLLKFLRIPAIIFYFLISISLTILLFLIAVGYWLTGLTLMSLSSFIIAAYTIRLLIAYKTENIETRLSIQVCIYTIFFIVIEAFEMNM